METTLFSKYFEKTPDVEKYLERIGFTGKLELTLECLEELTTAHQKAVPFENIDIVDYHLPVNLSIEHLYDKIVTNHRGGYCFENNTSFLSLLRGLGFDARPCMCRVTKDASELAPIRHKATIVTVDGKDYFLDVGFGGAMCTRPLEIREGASETTNKETFTFRRAAGSWWYLEASSPYFNLKNGVSGCETRVILTISTHLCITDDFVPYNRTCYQPTSPFYKARTLYIRTEEGCCKLNGSTFIEVKNDVVTTKELNEAEANAVLKDVFGIEVSKDYLEGMKQYLE